MILRTTGQDVAEQAKTGGYLGTPYEKLDCQAFVEQVLYDLNVRKADGTPYNWRGSNSMWRHYIKWKGTISECVKKFGMIPEGAFLFVVKHDGGEEAKGYHDGEGNAKHVGLYLGNKQAMHSPSPGKTVCCVSYTHFTHVGLMSMIDYSTSPEPAHNPDREAALKALETLTKYIKEGII